MRFGQEEARADFVARMGSTPPEMFPKYRDALVTLERPGVVLADMTAV